MHNMAIAHEQFLIKTRSDQLIAMPNWPYANGMLGLLLSDIL